MMEVIMKPTVACNGTCVYCSAAHSTPTHGVFPRARLGELFEVFAAWLRANPSRRLRFTWHGGEPLLCGMEFYRAVVRAQRRAFAADGPRVKNIIQSNLTLLTEQWLPCLAELLGDQPIGTSFDVVDGIRGVASGPPLAERWLSAMELLRGRGFRIGVVYVVHRSALGRAGDIYRYFRNLDPSLSVRFNPLYAEGRGKSDSVQPLAVTPQEYGEFLVEIARLWLDDGGRMTVMPFTEWRQAWRGAPPMCCDNRGDCHRTHLAVDPDGTVYHCGRASDNGAHPLGNLFQDELAQLLASPLRTRLGSRTKALRDGDCRDCRYWRLCHGGCPYLAWIYHGDMLRKTYFCPAHKHVFAYFAGRFGQPAPSGSEDDGECGHGEIF